MCSGLGTILITIIVIKGSIQYLRDIPGCCKSIKSWKCSALLSAMPQVPLPMTGTVQWWTRKRFSSLLRKQIIGAAITGLIYLIWWTRNRARIENLVRQCGLLS
ncbi:hypothetical protein vseg_007996 [Gypsophila vaccaria]